MDDFQYTLLLGGEKKTTTKVCSVCLLCVKGKGCKEGWGFPGGTRGKESPASAGDLRDLGSIPGSGRSSAGGHGNPLQYFGLENPMDRGAWWATAHRVAKSQTHLK